jgi:hypothetical protein
LLLVVTLGLAAVACQAPAPGYVPDDEAKALVSKCPIDGTIDSYFKIPKGLEYRDVFPKMGLSPELDGAVSPFVVVYSGEVDSTLLGGRPDMPKAKLTNVLCVVLAEGEPIVYADVSRDGMALPAGAHMGAPPK